MKMLLKINLLLVFNLSFMTILPKPCCITLKKQAITALKYYFDGQVEATMLQVDALLTQNLDKPTREYILRFKEQVTLEILKKEKNYR